MSGDGRPLAGRRILVTRRAEQSRDLVVSLLDLGAEVLELPTIVIAPPEDPEPLDRALLALHRYDWLVFTSANAVEAVAGRLRHLDRDGREVGRGTPVATVGAATSAALRAAFPGAEVAIEPRADYRAEGLLAAFRERGVRGQRFLLPVSDRARETLAEGLADEGARVESVAAYRTVPPPGLREDLERILLGGLDLATFASPSAVDHLAAAAGDRLRGLPAVVIGPVTEVAARRAGLAVRAVAHPSTTTGVLAAVLAALTSTS
jgi:uroporphyrinogen-III synthase